MYVNTLLRLISLALKLVALLIFVFNFGFPCMSSIGTITATPANELNANIITVLQLWVSRPLEGLAWFLLLFGGALALDLLLDMDARLQRIADFIDRRGRSKTE